MAISPASRTLQSLLSVRTLVISSCANKRYESSVPIRYIPKDSRIKIAQQSTPCESSSENDGNLIRIKLSKGERSSRKALNLADKEFRHDISGAGMVKTSDTPKQVEGSEAKDAKSAAPELAGTGSRNKSGMFLEDVSTSGGDNYTESNEGSIGVVQADAEEMAIKLLATRAFTTAEMQKKLSGKKFPLKVVNSVITDLKCRGLLNDGLYAESYSQSRWQSSAWGPRRIKLALVRKGISELKVEEAVKHVFEDEKDGDDRFYMQYDISEISLNHLMEKASKQWLRSGDISLERRKARIARWLQYRGFNWPVTNLIMKKLGSQYPL